MQLDIGNCISDTRYKTYNHKEKEIKNRINYINYQM